MYFSTIIATSALVATALAAPNAQRFSNRPPSYGRPITTMTVSSADSAAPIATTTAYITITEHDEATKSSTSSAIGGSSTSSSTVIVDPTAACSTATTTEVSKSLATTTHTDTESGAGVTFTVTETDYFEPTASACPTSNNTAPYPTGTGHPSPVRVNEQDAEQLAEAFRMLIQDYSTDLALSAPNHTSVWKALKPLPGMRGS